MKAGWLLFAAGVLHRTGSAAATGCNATAGYARQMGQQEGRWAPESSGYDLWLCAFENQPGGTYQDLWSACNEDDGYHLVTVSSMGASYGGQGLPANADMDSAMGWAYGEGFAYGVTGQPVRSVGWTDTYETEDLILCNGLGYVHVGERDRSGTGWQALIDRNDAGFRDWPSANCANAATVLISMCHNVEAIANSCVYDHRWRIGANIPGCSYTRAPTTPPPTTPSPTLPPTTSVPSSAPTKLPTEAPTTPGPTTSAPTCLAPTTMAPTPVQVTCGAGTTLVGVLCTIDASVCQQGTELAADGCVPDCTDLRRRDIDCPSCAGGTEPPGSFATADSDSEGGGSGVIIGVMTAVALLIGCVGFALGRRSNRESALKAAPRPGVENAMYAQPGESSKKDSFGFGTGGYMDVDGSG